MGKQSENIKHSHRDGSRLDPNVGLHRGFASFLDGPNLGLLGGRRGHGVAEVLARLGELIAGGGELHVGALSLLRGVRLFFVCVFGAEDGVLGARQDVCLFSPGAVQRVLGLVELALPRGERGGRLGDAVRVLSLPAETELLVALENL